MHVKYNYYEGLEKKKINFKIWKKYDRTTNNKVSCHYIVEDLYFVCYFKHVFVEAEVAVGGGRRCNEK